MEISKAIFYSRSAVVQDWKCARARFWNYEYNDRGLTPKTMALPLAFGVLVHDAMAAIAANLSIDDIVEAGKGQLRDQLLAGHEHDADAQYFAEEQCALGEGLIRGFHKHVWPRLMADYEIVLVEQEMTYEHDGLTFMAKPDLILRHKESGDLTYLEFKTTSSVKDQWITSWNTAVQVHSTIRAAERLLGEKISQVIIQGLNKGYVSYEKQNSPFCYLYHKPGTPPFVKDIWAYEYKAGLKRFPSWQREGGVKRLVEEMPDAILSQQFPQTPPIFINDDLVDAFFRQRAIREHEIRRGREEVLESITALDRYFPQNFEACAPGWGSGCDFKRLCHGKVTDPLQAGFETRVSHHEAERKQLDNHPGS